MKRWLLYLILLILVTLSPVRGTDISRLAPVEVIWISEQTGWVFLQTDTGEQGRGENVQSALENLKKSASANVFLETADYVIVERKSVELLDQCKTLLRPSCEVCMADQIPNMEKVAAFLTAHKPKVTLRQWQVTGIKLQILEEEDGRFRWNE